MPEPATPRRRRLTVVPPAPTADTQGDPADHIPQPRRAPTRPGADHRQQRYAEHQARLDAEAVERWQAVVADWPPMSDDQIRGIAEIFRRIDARTDRDAA